MRKPEFCICENKGTDLRFCFRYIDYTIPFLTKSELSNFLPSSVVVQPSFVGILTGKPWKTGFCRDAAHV